MTKDGVFDYWTEETEAAWKLLLSLAKTDPEKRLVVLLRAVVKYDIRISAGWRAIDKARRRMAPSTDADLQEMAEFEARTFSTHPAFSDISVNLERLQGIRERGRALQEARTKALEERRKDSGRGGNGTKP